MTYDSWWSVDREGRLLGPGIIDTAALPPTPPPSSGPTAERAGGWPAAQPGAALPQAGAGHVDETGSDVRTSTTVSSACGTSGSTGAGQPARSPPEALPSAVLTLTLH